MAMELEIEEEPEAEEEEEEEVKQQAGGAMAAGGVELEITLKNPEIHIDKLTVKKKE